MNETLTRTVCIKLDVAGNEAVLAETQHRFNEAASWVASLCWEERITNTNTAHHRVYGESRLRFGLGAQLAICARAKAMEAIKAVKARDAEKLARWRKTNARRSKKRAHYVAHRAALQRVGTRTDLSRRPGLYQPAV
jgi:putative transposase